MVRDFGRLRFSEMTIQKISEMRFKPCVVGIVVVVTAAAIVGHAVVCVVTASASVRDAVVWLFVDCTVDETVLDVITGYATIFCPRVVVFGVGFRLVL